MEKEDIITDETLAEDIHEVKEDQKIELQEEKQIEILLNEQLGEAGEKIELPVEENSEVLEFQEEINKKLPEEEALPSGNFGEKNSQKEEEIPEIVEVSKEVVISDEPITLESGLEIKYTSLQLKEFPIAYSNFSSRLTFDEVISIGTTSIKIGENIFNNVSLKILVYNKFKLLEIKTREFKLGLSIDLLQGENLVKKDDFFKYEIFSKLKTSRFTEVVNIFKRIFSGESIQFRYNKLIGNISFENRIEVYKFTILNESVETYNEVVKKLSLTKEKNIVEMKDSFYSLFLTKCSLKNERLSTWVNFRVANNYDIKSGDMINFERVHHLKLNGISFDLKECIKVLEPISQRDFASNNEICCYRKPVEITLEQIKKI